MSATPTQTKVCPRCRRELPRTDEHFAPHRTAGRMGLTDYCRGCWRDYNAERNEAQRARLTLAKLKRARKRRGPRSLLRCQIPIVLADGALKSTLPCAAIVWSDAAGAHAAGEHGLELEDEQLGVHFAHVRED